MRANGTAWRPRFDGADRLLAPALPRMLPAPRSISRLQSMRSQSRGRSLVGYGHGAVDPDGVWSWAADTAPPANGNAQRIVAPGDVSREVVGFYRVGDHRDTGSPARVKIETLRHRICSAGSQRASALLVSAEDAKGGRAATDRFVSALGALGPVDRSHIAEGR